MHNIDKQSKKLVVNPNGIIDHKANHRGFKFQLNKNFCTKKFQYIPVIVKIIFNNHDMFNK